MAGSLNSFVKHIQQPGTWKVGQSNDAGAGLNQFNAPTHNINQGAFGTGAVDDVRDLFQGQFEAIQNRGPVSAVGQSNIDMKPQGEFRAGQMTLAQQLADQAAGNGPSLAQSQLRQGTDRNIAQAMAMGATQRGHNPAAAMRQIGQATAAANQQMAAQSADLRANEMMAARGALGGVLAQGRGQDIGLATDQAGLNQQVNLANQQAQLQSRSLDDQMSRFYAQGQGDLAQRDREAAMAMEKLSVDQQLGTNTVNAGAHKSAGDARGGFIAGLGEGIGTVAKMFNQGGVIEGEDLNGKLKGYGVDSDLRQALANMNQQPRSGQEKMGGMFGSALSPVVQSVMKMLGQAGKALDEGTGGFNPKVTTNTGYGGGGESGTGWDSGDGNSINGIDDGTGSAGSGNIDTGIDNTGGGSNDEWVAFNGIEVPGQAKVPGDHPVNDTVEIKVSPGEVVLPRSISNSPEAARGFVQALMAEKSKEQQQQEMLAAAFMRNRRA